MKGASGCRCAAQISTVHLPATLGQLEYQTWPEDRAPERVRCRSADSLNSRLSLWTRKAAKTADVNLELQDSIQKADES